MSPTPPTCRHRGLECGADRWACHSPKLVIPGGLVSARDCAELCPFVDHPTDGHVIGDGYWPEGHGPAHGVLPGEARDRVFVDPAGSEDVAVAVLTAPRVIATLGRTL